MRICRGKLQFALLSKFHHYFILRTKLWLPNALPKARLPLTKFYLTLLKMKPCLSPNLTATLIGKILSRLCLT
ncbi:hypothetical protein [Moraxella lacunata]|uniref:hypothetical protein n=1 Tax=Moraxella lacunata TaxID=477 RepID=UPI003EE0EBFB